MFVQLTKYPTLIQAPNVYIFIVRIRKNKALFF